MAYGWIGAGAAGVLADPAERAAAEIADDLEQLGHELRTEFNRAIRTIAPVTFSAGAPP